MTGPVRRAGVGRRRDGTVVTWTVAEGHRGRRWRESVVVEGAVAWSLLYETDTDGRFSHLELATARGLATLHPEPDGSLHGNIVDAAGVHHVEGLAFAVGACLLVTGSTVAGAALAWAGAIAGEGTVTVAIDPVTLGLGIGSLRADDLVDVDDEGLPVLLDARTWPLEAPPEP